MERRPERVIEVTRLRNEIAFIYGDRRNGGPQRDEE